MCTVYLTPLHLCHPRLLQVYSENQLCQLCLGGLTSWNSPKVKSSVTALKLMEKPEPETLKSDMNWSVVVLECMSSGAGFLLPQNRPDYKYTAKIHMDKLYNQCIWVHFAACQTSPSFWFQLSVLFLVLIGKTASGSSLVWPLYRVFSIYE